MKVDLYSQSGEKKGQIDLPKEIFEVKMNEDLVHQALKRQLSNKRVAIAHTKTRGEVRGGGRKPFRQKGTGNARHGSKNAPIFVGGGIAHGPTGLTNWKLKLTKRFRSQALISALSAQKENIVVCDGFNNLTGKTKQAVELLSKIRNKNEKVLVVLTESKPEVIRGLRNIQRVAVTRVERINIYEVSLADKIIITTDAVKQIEEKLAKHIKVVKKDN